MFPSSVPVTAWAWTEALQSSTIATPAIEAQTNRFNDRLIHPPSNMVLQTPTAAAARMIRREAGDCIRPSGATLLPQAAPKTGVAETLSARERGRGPEARRESLGRRRRTLTAERDR